MISVSLKLRHLLRKILLIPGERNPNLFVFSHFQWILLQIYDQFMASFVNQIVVIYDLQATFSGNQTTHL